LFQPSCGLSMRIDYDRNLFKKTKYLTVFYGKLIIRKSLHNLLEGNSLISHEGKEIIIMTAQYLLPFLNLKMPNIFRTLWKISNKARSQGCVFRHHFNLHFQLITLYTPPDLLILQLWQQLLPTGLSCLGFFQLLFQNFSFISFFYKILI